MHVDCLDCKMKTEDGMNKFLIVTAVALCTALHAALPTVSSAQSPSPSSAELAERHPC